MKNLDLTTNNTLTEIDLFEQINIELCLAYKLTSSVRSRNIQQYNHACFPCMFQSFQQKLGAGTIFRTFLFVGSEDRRRKQVTGRQDTPLNHTYVWTYAVDGYTIQAVAVPCDATTQKCMILIQLLLSLLILQLNLLSRYCNNHQTEIKVKFHSYTPIYAKIYKFLSK